MTFNDIKNKVYFLTSTNSTSFPIEALTAGVNSASDRTTSIIMQSDGRWQWDDSNQTDFPVATTALVANQKDYTLSVAHLKILRVELKNQNGTWRLLRARDQSDITGEAISQRDTTTGTPDSYDKMATSVLLDPIPSYSQDASLKIYYQRGPAYFASTDSDKAPGFNALYHILLPLWTAYEYCLAKGLQVRLAPLMADITRVEAALISDYSRRSADERSQMTMKPIRFR